LPRQPIFPRQPVTAVLGRARPGGVAAHERSGRLSAQTPADYVIGPQDVLAIAVFDQTELSGRYSVETNGTFSFPLVGRVTAAGLTLRQFEKELTARLADGFFKNPQVTVGIEQYRSQRVFVMGEVRQPGPVALTGGMTLIEALARAGSTLTTASGELSIVRSKNSSGPVLPGQGDDAVGRPGQRQGPRKRHGREECRAL
jgi:polysaccharide export outer membrane protein